MRWLRFVQTALMFLVLVLAAVGAAGAVSASHSANGGAECGVNEWDGVGFMNKGRTDGMVFTVDHTVGCKTVKIRNMIGTGITEAYGYSGQQAACVAAGQRDAAMTFKYYFDTEIDPSSVKVACSRYAGPG